MLLKTNSLSETILSQSDREEKKKMKGMKVNMFYGAIATVMASVFGQYWFLFAGFLALNVLDYVTGVCKAKFFMKNESSAAGAKGIVKKVGYWLVIAVAFFIALCFKYIGDIFSVDLAFVQLFGWFTLASYLINEIRSVLENLVEMDVKVPKFLLLGLDIAEKMLETKTNIDIEEVEDET